MVSNKIPSVKVRKMSMTCAFIFGNNGCHKLSLYAVISCRNIAWKHMLLCNNFLFNHPISFQLYKMPNIVVRIQLVVKEKYPGNFHRANRRTSDRMNMRIWPNIYALIKSRKGIKPLLSIKFCRRETQLHKIINTKLMNDVKTTLFKCRF